MCTQEEKRADPVSAGYKTFFAVMGVMIVGSLAMAIFEAIRPLSF